MTRPGDSFTGGAGPTRGARIWRGDLLRSLARHGPAAQALSPTGELPGEIAATLELLGLKAVPNPVPTVNLRRTRKTREVRPPKPPVSRPRTKTIVDLGPPSKWPGSAARASESTARGRSISRVGKASCNRRRNRGTTALHGRSRGADGAVVGWFRHRNSAGGRSTGASVGSWSQ